MCQCRCVGLAFFRGCNWVTANFEMHETCASHFTEPSWHQKLLALLCSHMLDQSIQPTAIAPLSGPRHKRHKALLHHLDPVPFICTPLSTPLHHQSLPPPLTPSGVPAFISSNRPPHQLQPGSARNTTSDTSSTSLQVRRFASPLARLSTFFPAFNNTTPATLSTSNTPSRPTVFDTSPHFILTASASFHLPCLQQSASTCTFISWVIVRTATHALCFHPRPAMQP